MPIIVKWESHYMKVQSIEAVKKCVMKNLGLAIVPYYSVTEELKNGALIRIKTDLDDITFNSVCLYNKNKWISPQMELALKLIKSTVPR
ncbi:MAG: LysR substrate-binding domain-containing protein [Clostridiales bacterium]|nr:LysR substrate-binding domain-containing protein [Clostridiales bacterium]